MNGRAPYKAPVLVELALCDRCAQLIRDGVAKTRADLCEKCREQFARVDAGASGEMAAGAPSVRRPCPCCDAGELVELERDQADRLMPIVRQSLVDPTLQGYACSVCHAFVAIGEPR